MKSRLVYHWLLYVASLVHILLVPFVLAGSILLEEGTVISFDDASQSPRILRNTSILITNDRITTIFDSSNPSDVPIPTDTERVPAQGKIISPGFIDTHKHGWQTAYKTIASNTTLAEYYIRYGEFSQAETVFTPEDIYLGQLVGIYEALNAGVTSILDHAHSTFSRETASASLNASMDGGVRMWWCYAFHNISNGFSLEDQIENFNELKKDERLGESTVEVGIAYDGFSTAAKEEVQSIMDLATTSNISALTIHYLGGPWPRFSANSPKLLHDLDFLNTSFPIVFSHSSFITPEDASLLRQTNQYISTTPESEMHYGHDHPTTPFIQDQAALGVDTHFTYSADIVTQARLWLQSTRLEFFRQTLNRWRIPRNSPMSVNQAFLLATRAGGLALRRPDVGVIQVGAKADIVVFDGSSPSMLGWTDPVAAVILHSNVGDVEHVLVNGKWRKRDRQLVLKEGLNMSRDEVEGKFLESAKRIQEVWMQTPLPDLEGEFEPGLGVPYADVDVEDVVRGNGTGY
ncbi:Metallo-dependent hydrolase [Dendrothele bispora CBS 962.96]|uniref:Metallo-dependent hydrolase n=1 Tax=Dendrothele bispora (strain CBS 962.96) TaxID=1314807 RepID=A0A4S8L2X3_DENBC|nr:Metallo-dependent hydrolase [Dendrothele bispora CBS 962.96]